MDRYPEFGTRKAKILWAVVAYKEKYGTPPSSTQIWNFIGDGDLNKNTVHATLVKENKKGRLKRIPNCGLLGGSGWEITHIERWAKRLGERK